MTKKFLIAKFDCITNEFYLMKSDFSKEHIKHSVLFFLSLLDQDVVCDKNNAPSVSSISRVLRGGHTDGCTSDEGRTNHSIDGILGKT